MAVQMEKRSISSFCIVILWLGLIAYPISQLNFSPTDITLWGDIESKRLIWTVIQALASVLTCSMIAPYVAWLFARHHITYKQTIISFLWIPFITPTLIGAIGISRTYQNILGDQHPALLIIANIFFNLPFMIRYLISAFNMLPKSLHEAALLQKSSTFLIDLKAIKPQIFYVSIMIFLFCFSNFSLALILSGPKYGTIELELYERLIYEMDFKGSALIFWVIVLIKSLLYINIIIMERKIQKPYLQDERKSHIHTLNLLQKIWLCIVYVWIFLPFYYLFLGHNWSLPSHLNITETALRSIVYSTASVALAWFYIYFNAWDKTRWIFHTPLNLPSTGLGLALLMAYPSFLDQIWFLIMVFSLLATPYIQHKIDSALMRIPKSIMMNAYLQSDDPKRRALFPMIHKDIRLGLAIASIFAVDIGVSMTLQHSEWQTLYTLIYQTLGQAGEERMDQALTVAALTLIINWGLFFIWLGSYPKKSKY